MKIKCLISFLVLVSLTGNACAGTVLSLSAELGKDDSVKINYLRLEEGNPTFFTSGNYALNITDSAGREVYSTPLDVRFVLYADPPIAADSITLFLRIPYDSRMSNLAFYKGDRQIYSAQIDLCNKDGICDQGSESYLSCPADCPLDKPDGFCIKAKDGVCDPDCVSGADPDCANKLPAVSGLLPYLLAAAALMCAVVYAINKRKRG